MTYKYRRLIWRMQLKTSKCSLKIWKMVAHKLIVTSFYVETGKAGNALQLQGEFIEINDNQDASTLFQKRSLQ